MPEHNTICIVPGETPTAVEQFAAAELQTYLHRLFELDAPIATTPAETVLTLFLIGTRKNHVALNAALDKDQPKLGDQDFLLRKTEWRGRETLILLGGSPRAVLWAVYHLVEEWGVHYLLHGDVLPTAPAAFHLPDLNLVCRPILPVRQWRVINDFACGPESWGMEHYRPVIDQLAKHKFNRLFLSLFPYQPFLHYAAGGIERRSAALWFDFHYPITDDMVGRHLFGDAEEFWNPDLPRGADYATFAAAGKRHVQALIDHGRRRGMECVISISPTEYPPEFAPLLSSWQKVEQLGELYIVPGADMAVEDPGLNQLAGAILKAVANTYPEVDFIALGTPEFRQWLQHYERAWHTLDQRYGLEQVCPLADVLEAAQNRKAYPGGAARALREVQGDIVALYFYDRLLRDQQVFSDTRRPDMKIIINSVAEELYPILPLVAPEGAEILNFVDYTASRITRRRQVLETMPASRIPTSLIYTLHDDNVGLLPQITTGSLHQLTRDLQRHGWAGFSTRYWLTADHGPCVAYLARSAWDGNATPETVYREHIAATCGPDCVSDMLILFGEIEQVTLALEDHGLGLAFPVPGMILKHWTPDPMPEELIACRRGYQRASAAGQRALQKTSAAGKLHLEYWLGRLEFGIYYLDAIEAVRRAATAESKNQSAATLQNAETALEKARAALASYARIVRDQSDRGAIAVMNEYVYRPLKAKVEELQKTEGT